MARREEYEAKACALITPIVESKNFELVDVEYVKEGSMYYLRAYIDKEGGITVDDCEIVSREFSLVLDKEDFIEDSYIMEISSPGLGRPLKKDKDFARSIGEEVEIKLYKAVNKKKEDVGLLTAFDKESVTIERENGESITYNRADIALIRLTIDF